jgi:hypothetical protein
MLKELPVTFLTGRVDSVHTSVESEFLPPLVELPLTESRLGAADLTTSKSSTVAVSSQASNLGDRGGTASSAPDASAEAPSNIAVRRKLTQSAVVGKGSSFRTHQLWEGTVTDVRPTAFVATLRDLTDSANPDEQAEFERSEVSHDDRVLIAPGAAFYWVVGTELTRAGQKRNVSTLQFKRLPVWTDRAISRAMERGSHTKSIFGSAE